MSSSDQTVHSRQQSQPQGLSDNSVHWQSFAVPYNFPVCFTEDLFNPDNPLFRDVLCLHEMEKQHACVVFIDDGLLANQPNLIDHITRYVAHHAKNIRLMVDPISVPGGEQIKSELYYVEQIQQTLFHLHVDRHSYVIAIGGGAVLDTVGFVAAIAHRGVRHIRIPTTVLAQNDSGVGIKNGINFKDSKNYMGAFAPPFAVINDINFVLGLSDRDKTAGMAEAVKVALIRDAEFFSWIERNVDHLVTFEKEALEKLIRRCAELHMHQIAHAGDPFETGSVRPLDYGHWSAHKLETLTRYHLRHGESVAIGIVLDARYSVLTGLLKASEEDRIAFLLEHLGFKLWHPALEMKNIHGQYEVLQGLDDFQEHLGGELTVTLLTDIGTGYEVHAMDHDLLLKSIAWLKSRQQR